MNYLNHATTMLTHSDIAVVGTPHLNTIVYSLYACALGYNIRFNDFNFQYREIEWHNYRFFFETCSQKEELIDLQLHLIESELLQAIGRARVLREDCTVMVFSSLPITGAKFQYFDDIKTPVSA